MILRIVFSPTKIIVQLQKPPEFGALRWFVVRSYALAEFQDAILDSIDLKKFLDIRFKIVVAPKGYDVGDKIKSFKKYLTLEKE